MLDRAGFVVNYNTVPEDPRPPFNPSGVRLGTPAVTTRGMTEADMRTIAGLIDRVVAAVAKDDESALDDIAEESRELTAGYSRTRQSDVFSRFDSHTEPKATRTNPVDDSSVG